MKTIFTFLLFILALQSFAQTELSGKITDERGMAIPGANIYLEGTYDGASSDENGNFSFSTSETGTKVVVVSFLSFETFKKEIDVSNFKNQTIKLRESVNTLDAVIVTAGTFEAGDKARVSVLKPLDIVTTAGAAGDIIGALNTLPGTQTVGESGRLFVRGGEADETQTFVDGLRVAQPYGATAQNLPTRGRFSPFLFNGISFSTGGYSAEFGEALSSVLTLNTIDEPTQEQTDISLMTVGLGIGNTQKWNKNSFTFNAAYINLEPYQKLVPQAVDWNKPYQSLAGEMVYRYQFKNGLLKVYGAFDVAQLDINQEDINQPEKVRFDLRNDNFYGNASYKGTFGNSWNLHTGVSYGLGLNKIGINSDQVKNDENAIHLKMKVGKKITERIKISAGADYFVTDFDEKFTEFEGQSFKVGYQNSIAAVYAESDIFFSKKLAMKLGARASQTSLLEEFRLSPRASFAYKVSKNSQFSFAYGDFVQTPRADYIKYSDDFQSEKASHYIFNFQHNKDGRLFRAEAYYKKYHDLVKFDTNGAQFNSAFTNDGFGYAKGIDIFWRDNKTFKNTEYWVSYSYIDTERDYLNFPNQVTPSFVADHTLSVVTKHWIEDWKSQIGFSYTVNSGRPYNNPNELEFMNGKTKAFQNLSFNWAYLLSQQKILYFSVSNIIGTDNVFGYQYANSPDLNGQFQRRAIGQPADRFFFVGFFWTISENKKTNQLENL
ncbi:TonB-dependent receptor [Flavobacterium piscinae]|uniref:TonB-dependent receptor n=1 Tax=Flavobacterium piscinae TaxID=2506424 RepID=A0A4Q1KR88_9FLAO|nr:TonB-dependent receptor [Flavobacterium piscinae]RXR31829.1 TonB-dependent receptor [Flavobacterium piscinae]